MENRFGVKDFFLFLLLSVLIVVVLLAMIQYDRQWTQLTLIKNELTSQTRDLSNLRQSLADGIQVGTVNRDAGSTAAPTTQAVTQESRYRAVTKLPGYATGDWLVQSTSSPPTRLTPLLDADLFGSRMQDLIFESLAVRDPETLKFIPCLATDWDQSPDGLTLTFRMRRDAVFSDGSPLTADDVIYTFELAQNPQIEAERQRVYLKYVSKVEKLDTYTVRITFSEFYFLNFESVATTNILSKAFYEKYAAKDFNESVGLAMGSGQYRLADPANWHYEPGKPFELIRNERHSGVAAPFDRIVYNMQSDAGARLIAFKNGDTDRFAATPEQYRDLIKDTSLTSHTQNFKFIAPDDGYFYVGWYQVKDGQPTKFADKRVRQAMTMLIDRESIVRDVLYGYATVATGPFDPKGAQCDPSIKPWPFDPDAAKKLLADAGFTDRDNDGILEGPDGKPFTFKLSYPSGSSVGERVALSIKDSMRRGGVLCEPESVEWSVLLDRIRNRQVEANFSGWGGSVDDDLYQIFHSSGIEGQGDNRVNYSNPAIDALIVKARTCVDDTERSKLWQQCHKILYEDQPYTFLFRDDNLVFLSDRFQNVKTNKMGVNSFREWFVPAAKQKWGH